MLEAKAASPEPDPPADAARCAEARAQIGITSADRFPTIGTQALAAAASATPPAAPTSTPPTPTTASPTSSSPSPFSYEVDLWGRIRRNIAVAKEEAQATAADLQTTLLSLQAELAIDYFELRSADAQTEAARTTPSRIPGSPPHHHQPLQGGVVAKSDVYQAQTQLQAAVVQLSDIAVQRAKYEHAIAILIGQPPNSFSLPPAPLDMQPPAIPAGLPSQLLERRPDIAAAERRAAEANERIGIARAAFFPTLGFCCRRRLREPARSSSLLTPSNIVYALGPTPQLHLLRRGPAAAAQSAQARRRISTAASADYKQTVLTAFQQVEDNLVALRVLAQEAEQQRQATERRPGCPDDLQQPLRRRRRHLPPGHHRPDHRAHQRAQRHRHPAPPHGRHRAPRQSSRRRLVHGSAAQVLNQYRNIPNPATALLAWLPYGFPAP